MINLGQKLSKYGRFQTESRESEKNLNLKISRKILKLKKNSWKKILIKKILCYHKAKKKFKFLENLEQEKKIFSEIFRKKIFL